MEQLLFNIEDFLIAFISHIKQILEQTYQYDLIILK